MTTVHFYGDSFTAGFGDPASLGWVGRVATVANEQGQPFRAVNHGVPGATSVAIARQWLAATDDPRNAELEDTKVVFSFGTNDVISGVSSDQSMEALESALDRASHHGIPAFVVGPPPVGDLPEADESLSALSYAFSRYCELTGAPYLETHDHLSANAVWQQEIAAGDGSHPQAGGYAALAEYLLANSFLDWIRY